MIGPQVESSRHVSNEIKHLGKDQVCVIHSINFMRELGCSEEKNSLPKKLLISSIFYSYSMRLTIYYLLKLLIIIMIITYLTQL